MPRSLPRSLTFLLPLPVLLALACGDPPPTPPLTGQLTLGTVDPIKYGDERWVDLKDGQDVQLYPGAQGGFHIWLLYRVQNVSGMVTVDRIADRIGQDGSSARVLTTQDRLEIPAGPSWQVPEPIRSFMCPTPIGIGVIDQTIQLDVRISDPSGTALAHGQVKVVAHCPPASDPQHPFCEMICSG